MEEIILGHVKDIKIFRSYFSMTETGRILLFFNLVKSQDSIVLSLGNLICYVKNSDEYIYYRKKIHGLFIEYYSNGLIYAKQKFNLGNPISYRFTYFENGHLKTVEKNTKKNLTEGLQFYFYATYPDCIRRISLHQNGILSENSTIEYYPSGAVESFLIKFENKKYLIRLRENGSMTGFLRI